MLKKKPSYFIPKVGIKFFLNAEGNIIVNSSITKWILRENIETDFHKLIGRKRASRPLDSWHCLNPGCSFKIQ